MRYRALITHADADQVVAQVLETITGQPASGHVVVSRQALEAAGIQVDVGNHVQIERTFEPDPEPPAPPRPLDLRFN